jgi:hypothetical protein
LCAGPVSGTYDVPPGALHARRRIPVSTCSSKPRPLATAVAFVEAILFDIFFAFDLTTS